MANNNVEQNDMFDPLRADVDDLLAHLDEVEIDDAHAWPQTLADMVAVARHHLQQRRGYTAEAAAKEAQALVTLFANWFGGRMMYLPRDTRLRTALRDNLIWQQFNGRNVNELAELHGLTVMQIYNILREQRRLHVSKVQHDLFGDQDIKTL